MLICFNGQFLPEEQVAISPFDRSVLYGDGLFETIRLYAGKPFCWSEHLDRFEAGARFLGITVPFSRDELAKQVSALAQRTSSRDALVRLHLSRGAGPRGYSPAGAVHPWLAASIHSLPQSDPTSLVQWRLATASVRLDSNDPLTQFKTCNRLPQVLARAEAERQNANEALLLNRADEIAEASSANLFWIVEGTVHTPPLRSGALPGITRRVVLNLCAKLGIAAAERVCLAEDLLASAGVFLTLSSYGIVEALSLDGRALRQSALTQTLFRGYQGLISSSDLPR